jgi:hypothetical protein
MKWAWALLAFWLVLQYPHDRYYTLIGPYTKYQCEKQRVFWSKVYPKAKCVQMQVIIPS